MEDKEGKQKVRSWFSRVAMLVWLIFPAGATGQSQPPGFDHFQLFTRCAPIGVALLVEGQPILGLAQGAVERAVTSRLRSARIYNVVTEGPGFLQVRVASSGLAFVVGVEFQKMLRDEFTGGAGSATTWRSLSIGTHRNNGQFVRASLAEHMDKFIDEYLRVNGAWC